MTNLIFIIYFIDFLNTVDCLVTAVISVSVIIFIFSPIFIGCGIGELKAKNIDPFVIYGKYIKPYIKRFLLVELICLILAITIPNQRTLYIMAGLYAGDKVVTTITNNETFQKAEKLLNQKLDEQLEKNK